MLGPRRVGSLPMGATNMKIDAEQRDDRIRLYCTAHPRQLAIVTRHEGQWAYCPGGYVAAVDGHAWAPIAPTDVHQVSPRHVGFVVAGKATVLQREGLAR
jgi:hypothetical protein